MTFKNTMPNAMEPIEVERIAHGNDTQVERSHPAFGMIGANRVSGVHGSLFGSQIQHSGAVHITLKSAKEVTRMGSPWYFGDKIIASVVLSEAQWASFVSGMNIGDGVPCTIEYRHEGDFKRMPSIIDKSFQEKRADDIEHKMREMTRKYQDAVNALDALIASGKIGKRALEEVRSMFLHPVDYAGSNAGYAGKVLTEHAEKLVTEAKAEVEAYVLRAALLYPQLANQGPTIQQIEDKS